MRELPKARLDSIVSLVTDKTSGQKDPSKPYLGLEHLPSMGSSVLGMGSAQDSVSINNKFHAGDILFGKLRPRLRKSVRVLLEGYCSTDILVLRAYGDTNAAFAGFVLQSDAVFSQAIRTEEGTKMPRCSWGTLRKLEVFCPDNRQQQRLAEVLQTVDEAIEQTEALIAKTQRIKAGLMHDLFTRGVTPDGQLRPPRKEAPKLYKDSPLGWIPKEWELKRCTEICLCVIDCKNRTPPSTEEGHPVIRTPNVRGGEFVWTDLLFTDRSSYSKWTERGRPAPGDVVITREAPVGEVCMIPPDVEAPCLGQRMMLYRPDPDLVLGHFFLEALQSPRVQKHLDVISGGSTVGHVRVGDIRNLRVPWTQKAEQEIISSTLGGIRNQLTSLVAEAKKLQTLKAGLMHDLLTGRVRVPVADAPKVAVLSGATP